MSTTFNIKLNKRILIVQPYFLGDILFVMAIAQKFVNDGYDVVFPVRDEYLNLKKNFPSVNLVSINTIPDFINRYSHRTTFEDSEYIALPLHKSVLRTHVTRHMQNKYEYLGFPMDMWRDFKITRDFEKEEQLFKSLGLKEGELYNLINEYHRPFFHKMSIAVENGHKNIYMSKIEDYSLLDWIGVMEKAQSIHTIATSLQYLMDTIDTMPADMHIYRRAGDKEGTFHDHSLYEYIFKKNYVYH